MKIEEMKPNYHTHYVFLRYVQIGRDQLKQLLKNFDFLKLLHITFKRINAKNIYKINQNKEAWQIK